MDSEYLALVRTCFDDPHNPTPKLVIADWLEENGENHRASKWILEAKIPAVLRVGYRTKYGNGYGNGNGDGNGNGNGYGTSRSNKRRRPN